MRRTSSPGLSGIHPNLFPWLTLPAALVAVAVEGWFFRPRGIPVALTVIVVFANGVRCREFTALVIGAGAGLFVDLASGTLLGINTLTLGVVGFSASALQPVFLRIEGVISIVLVGILTLLEGFLSGILLQVFLEFPLSVSWISHVILRGACTALVWIPGAFLWTGERDGSV